MSPDLCWPLQRNVIRRNAVSNTVGMVRRRADGTQRPHQGWDFEAATGMPCFAIADGRVELISAAGDYGKLVVVSFPFDGETLFAAYAHLSAVKVTAGERVVKGQPIGLTGDSGNARGMSGRDLHLHFEVRTQPRPGRGLAGRLSPLNVFRAVPLDTAIEV